MGHNHSVRDMGAHFTIDQFTRQIKNDSAEKTTIVQYDHNSERLTFEIPLYVDGHAMTLCDLIEIHFINIATDGKSQNPGVYEVTDIKAEGEKAIFTWLISQEATQLAGSLNFFIVFKCTENGVTVYRWGTEIYKNLAISAGMDNGEAVLTEYPDILAQWKAQLFDASNTAVTNVATAEANALAAIEAAGEAKKQSVLDSIPDEYEALSALADSNYRNKAGAIVLDAEGESIVVNDASVYPLQNLKVFGRSTQDETPTPDVPVDIVSVENPCVSVHGKNLLNVGQYSLEGASITVPLFEGFVKLPVVLSWNQNFDRTAGSALFVFVVDGERRFRSSDEFAGKGELIITDGNALTSVTLVNWANETGELTDMQLELGEGATDYEAPIMQTVETSHTLPGIPVSSGGNYTDENGQQWICDEVDLARGVYIKRIGMVALTGGESWLLNSQGTEAGVNVYHFIKNGDYMLHSRGYCTHFKNGGSWSEGLSSAINAFWVANDSVVVFKTDGTQPLTEFKDEIRAAHDSGNPVTLYYVSKSPVETPLSEAEINAFRALHSNKPNTTILNDAGAYMAVEYVADTKTYIDNKIKEMMEVE